jgi:hypothetical protein
MSEEKDLLAKATEAVNNTQVPPGPPQEVVDATVTRLTKAVSQAPGTGGSAAKIRWRTKNTRQIVRFAAAAVLLIGAGYLIGRFSAPAPPDSAELYAALKPVIQQELLEPMHRQWLLALASSNMALKDELHAEFRQDLNRFAVQTLAASGLATNQLLREWLESVSAAQMRDRRTVAAVLREIEQERIRDQAELATGLETLAVLTGDELQRTKQDIVQLLASSPARDLRPAVDENSDTTKERSKP